MEKLTFQGEDGTTEEFYVLEQTRVGGVNYLLVADSEDEDGECLILRDVAGDEAQICSACAEHGSIGEHFGDAGDPVDRDNDLHCIEELARLGPRIVVRAYRDGHKHEGCNGGYRRNSAPDMYFFAVGLSVLFTHLHFPPYQPLHSR